MFQHDQDSTSRTDSEIHLIAGGHSQMRAITIVDSNELTNGFVVVGSTYKQEGERTANGLW